ASTDHHGDRHLWQAFAESKWSALETRGSVEIRLQRNQSDRRDPLCREAAHQFMDGVVAGSLRLLCERQSLGRSSAMEPGPRAAHRRDAQSSFGWRNASDTYVQRLRGTGCANVCGNGLTQELLNAGYSRRRYFWPVLLLWPFSYGQRSTIS